MTELFIRSLSLGFLIRSRFRAKPASTMSKRSRSITLKVVAPREGGEAPIVALFPSGEPLGTELSVECTTNTAEYKRHQRTVVARGPASSSAGVSYTGRNFGAEKPAPQLSRDLIGVYDRRSGTLRLVEIDHIYSMRQTLERSGDGATDAGHTELEYRTQQNMLINAFGSKRRKKTQKANASNLVSAERMQSYTRVEAALNRTAAAGASPGAGAGGGLQASRIAFLPPFDAEATNPARIYDMMASMPREVRGALLPSAKEYIALLKDPALLAARIEGSDEVRRLRTNTARRLTRLVECDAKARKRGCLLLVYEQLLMRMNSMGRVISGDRVDKYAEKDDEETEKAAPRGAVEVLAERLKVDAVVVEHLLATFADEDTASREGGGLESDDESADDSAEESKPRNSRCVNAPTHTHDTHAHTHAHPPLPSSLSLPHTNTAGIIATARCRTSSLRASCSCGLLWTASKSWWRPRARRCASHRQSAPRTCGRLGARL